ncbi:MAG: hypothetical protein WBR33_06495 [Pseudonocardiaceae bacterium]
MSNRLCYTAASSGTTRNNRAGLDQALAAVWDGSVFSVTKFDRFARKHGGGQPDPGG